VPDAGRVITGSAGGLRLDAPGPGTRPLSDRVKQALFGMIEAERGDAWERPFLDLFAGSGAAGIEALSRGAPLAVLVERDGRAASVIQHNLERTGLASRARVVRRDVSAFLAAGPGPGSTPFGCVFLDPPYADAGALAAALERLAVPPAGWPDASAGWLDASVVVVAKHFWKTPPPALAGELQRTRERRFGETALCVYRRASESAAGGS
jgi:16S rRNA (guanine966-N2)-methyltransferase